MPPARDDAMRYQLLQSRDGSRRAELSDEGYAKGTLGPLDTTGSMTSPVTATTDTLEKIIQNQVYVQDADGTSESASISKSSGVRGSHTKAVSFWVSKSEFLSKHFMLTAQVTGIRWLTTRRPPPPDCNKPCLPVSWALHTFWRTLYCSKQTC